MRKGFTRNNYSKKDSFYMRMMMKTLNFFCRCNTQIGDGLIFEI
jgi:hypothetical protein